MNTPLYGLNSLREVLTRHDILRVVRNACVQHAHDKVISAKSGELLFQNPPGDCHIRFGYFRGAPTFVIKVAMGFYENPTRGLETNNGLMMVFSSLTGNLIAILNDEGWLTSWRTAAAGALAAKRGLHRVLRRWAFLAAAIRPNCKRCGLRTSLGHSGWSSGAAPRRKPSDWPNLYSFTP